MTYLKYHQKNNLPPVHKNKLTFGIVLIGFYFAFIFLLLPSGIFFAEDTNTRFPLFLGSMMIGVSVITGRNVGKFRVPLFWTILMGMGFITSGFWGPSGGIEAIRLFFAQTGLAMAMVLVIKKPNQLNFLLHTVLWVALLNALYGLIFVTPGLGDISSLLEEYGMPSGRTSGEVRLTGFLSDPTYCGLMLMTGFFIALNELYERQFKKIIYYFASFIILFLGIFSTFSRTTWLATLFGLVIFFSMKRGKLNPKRLLLIGIGFSVLFIFNEFLMQMLEVNIARTNLQRSDSRSWIWLSYFNIAFQNPFGLGLGSIEEIRQFATSWHSATSTARPHNLFLNVWIESGLQTLVPFIALLIVAASYGWSVRTYIDPYTKKPCGDISFVILLSLIVGVFALGGMMQLVMFAVALNLVSWIMVKEGYLIPLDKFTRFDKKFKSNTYQNNKKE